MAENLPYLVSPGMISTALQKIKAAATPERFTQDFLANTLGMKGGSPKPLIPFLKRIGFLGTDGAPTELYKAFRNAGQSGSAVAQAMRVGYKALFDMNERAHELTDPELKGLIVQATGLEERSRVVQLTHQTFKALKQQASFGRTAIQVKRNEHREESDRTGGKGGALSANMSETVTPWEFRVEGEAGSESDERIGAGPRWAGDRGGGEGDAAAVHGGVQAEDRPRGRRL